jgi:restriction endonuclease
MAAYNSAVIHGYLAIVDNPPTNAAKGKAFEDLACYLLSGIPGIKITARNEMNTFVTEEIDVACKSENDPAGLGGLVDFFLVECKGWRDAVNSEQVSWFLTKIRHRGVRFGILIAADGITGEPEHLSRTNFLVGAEMATFGIKMGSSVSSTLQFRWTDDGETGRDEEEEATLSDMPLNTRAEGTESDAIAGRPHARSACSTQDNSGTNRSNLDRMKPAAVFRSAVAEMPTTG